MFKRPQFLLADNPTRLASSHHSDGAGQVDQVADGASRSGCVSPYSPMVPNHIARFALPLNTVTPAVQTDPLPANVKGARLGISGITAHRAMHLARPGSERTVLCRSRRIAVQLAR
jgi:hypothetical protein